MSINPKRRLGQHFLIDENILGVIGRLAQLAIAIDVTEKKKAQDGIRESAERMRQATVRALQAMAE